MSRTAIAAGFPERLALIAILLALDKLVMSQVVIYDTARATGALGDQLHFGAVALLRFVVLFAAMLAALVLARGGEAWRSRYFPPVSEPIRWRWVVVHAVLVVPLVFMSHLIFLDDARVPPLQVLLVPVLLLAVMAILTALAAIARWATWRALVGRIGMLATYAGIVAAAGTLAINHVNTLWPLAARATLASVSALLRMLLPSVTSNPERLTLATDRFGVEIAPSCSGLEGMALMLAFTVGWLICFRREYRLPRALLLIPAALALSYGLNILRIAALVLIGHSGYPEVAVSGFHSQAGWITFAAGAIALAYFSLRSPWMSRTAGAQAPVAGNLAAAYLMPFLAILAGGMAAHAASSGFEYLYPLRLVACVTALWIYRRPLLDMDWRCSWRGALAGAGVFAVWVLFARASLAPTGMPAGLAQLSPASAFGWIALRAAAAVVTVPLAEELAYRGFLQRRWQRADFESLDFKAVRWPALALTAAAFGLAHGAMWPAGVIAGLVYGGLAKRTGRLGESVMAHATTNALLAALVLCAGQWQYW